MNVAILFEATDDGYVEVSRGSYENLRDYYEQTYRRATDEIYGNLEGFESNKGRDIWNLHLHEDRRDDDGGLGKNEKEKFQIREKRNNEHSGGSGEESLNNGSMKYSYGDEEVDLYGLLDFEESGDTKVSKRLQSFIDIAEEAFSEKQNAVFTRAYTLKHIEIVANFDNSVHLDNKGLTGSQLTTDISISELFEFVKKYDAKFTPKPANPLFLNEDGTPIVYYHGTKAEFTEFDRTKSTKKHLNVLGEGNYFTSRRSAADRYEGVKNIFLLLLSK